VDLIESVLAQDYRNFEHIIIDDGSDDGGATVAILQRYPHLRWWSRENRGQYPTMNEGLEAARGDLITCISADDRFVTPGAFRTVIAYCNAHPACDLVYGKTLQMDEAGTLFPYQTDITARYSQWALRHYLFVQHCSLFVRRGLIADERIVFDASLRYRGDWDWIIRLFKQARQIGYLPRPLSVFRVHRAQTTQSTSAQALTLETREVLRRHGASYRTHRLIRALVSYRAMSLIGLATLRTQGASALKARVVDWVR